MVRIVNGSLSLMLRLTLFKVVLIALKNQKVFLTQEFPACEVPDDYVILISACSPYSIRKPHRNLFLGTDILHPEPIIPGGERYYFVNFLVMSDRIVLLLRETQLKQSRSSVMVVTHRT